MIWRGDRERIYRRVFQNSAKIFHALRLARLLFRHDRNPLFHGALVHIAHVRDLNIRHREMLGEWVCLDAATYVDDARVIVVWSSSSGPVGCTDSDPTEVDVIRLEP